MNGKNSKARIALNGFKSVYLSNMNEQVICELPLCDDVVELDVSAHKIVTLLMKK